jgi:hypothetical protein
LLHQSATAGVDQSLFSRNPHSIDSFDGSSKEFPANISKVIFNLRLSVCHVTPATQLRSGIVVERPATKLRSNCLGKHCTAAAGLTAIPFSDSCAKHSDCGEVARIDLWSEPHG